MDAFAAATGRMVDAAASGRAILHHEIAQWAGLADQAGEHDRDEVNAAVMKRAGVHLAFALEAAIHAAALMGPCPELDYAKRAAGRLR